MLDELGIDKDIFLQGGVSTALEKSTAHLSRSETFSPTLTDAQTPADLQPIKPDEEDRTYRKWPRFNDSKREDAPK